MITGEHKDFTLIKDSKKISSDNRTDKRFHSDNRTRIQKDFTRCKKNFSVIIGKDAK